MTVDINAYLARSYGGPDERPSWLLVADVYRRELGLPAGEFKTVSPSIRAIAAAFRLALSKGACGFMQISGPQDFAVILLSRWPRLGMHHAGVVIGGGVLHATETGVGGVINQDLATVLDGYRVVEYWARAEHAWEAP